jgi:hypothetical protein
VLAGIDVGVLKDQPMGRKFGSTETRRGVGTDAGVADRTQSHTRANGEHGRVTELVFNILEQSQEL